MTENKELTVRNALKVRARAKSKKPAFVRPESWRYDKLSPSWRRPRGLDNKVRRKIKGWPPAPSAGYRGPKAARGVHPSGYEEVIVHNVAEISKINAETQAVRIAHTVGKKKRVMIIAEARKLGVTVLNAKEVKEPVKEETEAEPKETADKTKKDKTEHAPKEKSNNNKTQEEAEKQ